jgi:hypothetical protein
MEDLLQKLEDGIMGEIHLGSKFIALLEQKKESIVKNDTEVMNTLNKEENDTIQQIEELGYARQDLVLQISNTMTEFRVTENLNDLIMQINDDSRSEGLIKSRRELLKNYNKIAQLSKLNGELLAQSIGFTQHLFNRISSADRKVKNGNYSPYGNKKKTNVQATIFKERV